MHNNKGRTNFILQFPSPCVFILDFIWMLLLLSFCFSNEPRLPVHILNEIQKLDLFVVRWMVLGERRAAMLTWKKIIGTTRKSYFNLAAVDISIFAIHVVGVIDNESQKWYFLCRMMPQSSERIQIFELRISSLQVANNLSTLLEHVRVLCFSKLGDGTIVGCQTKILRTTFSFI